MPDIDVGQISEALNDKLDLDGNNAGNPCCVVIETQRPTSSNNYQWYRLWSDGWCEQGGYIETSGSTDWNKISLIKNYADTNYLVVATNAGSASTQYNVKVGSPSKNNADGFYIVMSNNSTGAWWRAEGYTV